MVVFQLTSELDFAPCVLLWTACDNAFAFYKKTTKNKNKKNTTTMI